MKIFHGFVIGLIIMGIPLWVAYDYQMIKKYYPKMTFLEFLFLNKRYIIIPDQK